MACSPLLGPRFTLLAAPTTIGCPPDCPPQRPGMSDGPASGQETAGEPALAGGMPATEEGHSARRGEGGSQKLGEVWKVPSEGGGMIAASTAHIHEAVDAVLRPHGGRMSRTGRRAAMREGRESYDDCATYASRLPQARCSQTASSGKGTTKAGARSGRTASAAIAILARALDPSNGKMGEGDAKGTAAGKPEGWETYATHAAGLRPQQSSRRANKHHARSLEQTRHRAEVDTEVCTHGGRHGAEAIMWQKQHKASHGECSTVGSAALACPSRRRGDRASKCLRDRPLTVAMLTPSVGARAISAVATSQSPCRSRRSGSPVCGNRRCSWAGRVQQTRLACLARLASRPLQIRAVAGQLGDWV